MTFTGLVGTVVGFPLRLIISASVALRVHPNVLTLVGVLINVAAAWALALGHFVSAGVIMTLANIFDYIDGKVAAELKLSSDFGGFWDSVMDRFSDISLFVGLIYLYSERARTDYVMVTALAMMFAILTSYTRARAESLVDKCKVGFMERPERIVLFMIGAFTNRMAGVLWVILVLSVSTVFARIYFTWRALQARAGTEARFEPERDLPMPFRAFWHSFYWTFERATWQYDVMVILILAFVWLTPPDWIADPMARGTGPVGHLIRTVLGF
jgi:CDP-diacylglycerol--glycerol-3-phosphate 3-phosphatidyltransferase